MAPNGGQPGGIWREVVTNRVPFGSRHCTFGAPLGAKWRHVARNLIGATWRAPLQFQWIPIGGLFAPKGDMLAPFGATWRTLGADCSMQVVRRKISNILKFSCRHIQIWCRDARSPLGQRQLVPVRAKDYVIGA